MEVGSQGAAARSTTHLLQLTPPRKLLESLKTSIWPGFGEAMSVCKIRDTKQGVEIKVRAVPSGRRTELRRGDQAALKAVVTQNPERGKANAALLKLISKGLGLRRSQLTLVRGNTSRNKTYLITDASLADLQTVIDSLPE